MLRWLEGVRVSTDVFLVLAGSCLSRLYAGAQDRSLLTSVNSNGRIISCRKYSECSIYGGLQPEVGILSVAMRIRIDGQTRYAIKHTTHCLIGCGIGEILGMLMASLVGWHRIGRLPLAIAMAFLVGYGLTYQGVRKQTDSAKEAIKITAATDTVSIASMELVDNTIEFLIPNALLVTATQPRFWWGLALSLLIAFAVTVPVNRYMMGKSPHTHHS